MHAVSRVSTSSRIHGMADDFAPSQWTSFQTAHVVLVPSSRSARAVIAVVGPGVCVFAPICQQNAFLRVAHALSCCRATMRRAAAAKCQQCL